MPASHEATHRLSLLDRLGSTARVGERGRPTPAMLQFLRSWVLPAAETLHRPTLEGTEHLPASGPFVLVANHSAASAAEIGAFAALYVKQVGADRALVGVAHPIAFHLWPLTVFMRHAGAIPSTREACTAALADGLPLLIFPGGDYEAFRPVWQANRVDFGGRLGFLRLAREAGVPIVPMAIRGSHYAAPLFWRSRILAWVAVWPRIFGVKRWPLTAIALLGATATWFLAPWPLGWRLLAMWLWVASPLGLLSWVPSTIRMRIGHPVDASDLFGGEASEAALRRALARVEGEIQKLLDGGR